MCSYGQREHNNQLQLESLMIDQYLNECMKDENSVALRTLIEFASEHPEGKVIFHQLASLVDTGNLVYLKALETFLLEIFTHESEQIFSKSQIGYLISELMLKGSHQIGELIMRHCRQSQTVCIVVLHSLNEHLAQSPHFAYTIDVLTIFGLAMQLLHRSWEISNELLQQTLKLITFVIQIDRLCLETFVSDLSLLASISNINGSSIIGQQFYLVGLLTQLLARDYPSIIFQSDFDALVRKCLDYIIEIIKPDADLSKQISKAKSASESHVLRALFRGISMFLCQLGCSVIGKHTNYEVLTGILSSLSTVQDTVSHGEIILLLNELNQQRISLFAASDQTQMNNGSLLSLNLLDQGILLHCLPVQQGALSEERTRRIDEIFQLTLVMDRAQSKLLDAVLLKYEQSHQHKGLSEFVLSIVNTTLEEQYDHKFNQYRFSCACNLLIRAIARAAALKGHSVLKQACIDYLKMLLNLNQSCVLAHRQCINDKILDLLVVCPVLLHHNCFMQEITENIILQRLPRTMCHLDKLVSYYTANIADLFTEEQTKDYQKRAWKDMVQSITARILPILQQCSLTVETLVALWMLLFRLQHNSTNFRSILQLFDRYDELYVTKRWALKVLDWANCGVSDVNRLEKIKDRLSHHPARQSALICKLVDRLVE